MRPILVPTVRLLVAGPLLWGLFLAGCSDDSTESPAGGGGGGEAPVADPAQTNQEPEPIAPGDTIGQEMQLRAQQFAANMTPATEIFRGTLATGDNQDYQAVLQSDRCFKIVGVGGEGVTDLDLFLFDPSGAQVQQDTASDPYPVIGLTHPICPDRAGAFRVQVRMFEGAGDYGVRVYQSAP